MNQEDDTLNDDEDNFLNYTYIAYNRHIVFNRHDKAPSPVYGRYYLNEHNITDTGNLLLDTLQDYTGPCTTTLLDTHYTFNIQHTPNLYPWGSHYKITNAKHHTRKHNQPDTPYKAAIALLIATGILALALTALALLPHLANYYKNR